MFTGAEKTLELPYHFQGTTAQSITYTTSSTTAGEEPIEGLAASLYAALGTEQPAGTASWVEAEVDPAVQVGCKLNLTGVRTLTGAVIQSVTAEIMSGRTSVAFGPMSGRLSPEQFVSLQRNGQRSRPYSGTKGEARTDPAPGAGTGGGTVEGGTATRISDTPAPKLPEGGVSKKWFTVARSGTAKVTVKGGRVQRGYFGVEGAGYPLLPTYGKIETFTVDGVELTGLANGDCVFLKIKCVTSTGFSFTEGDTEGIKINTQALWADSATIVKGAASLDNTYVSDEDGYFTYVLIATIGLNTETDVMNIDQHWDGVFTCAGVYGAHFNPSDYPDGLPYAKPGD
jgi:hypothetical protein